jgi:hypothetical protein
MAVAILSVLQQAATVRPPDEALMTKSGTTKAATMAPGSQCSGAASGFLGLLPSG